MDPRSGPEGDLNIRRWAPCFHGVFGIWVRFGILLLPFIPWEHGIHFPAFRLIPIFPVMGPNLRWGDGLL